MQTEFFKFLDDGEGVVLEASVEWKQELCILS